MSLVYNIQPSSCYVNINKTMYLSIYLSVSAMVQHYNLFLPWGEVLSTQGEVCKSKKLSFISLSQTIMREMCCTLYNMIILKESKGVCVKQDLAVRFPTNFKWEWLKFFMQLCNCSNFVMSFWSNKMFPLEDFTWLYAYILCPY